MKKTSILHDDKDIILGIISSFLEDDDNAAALGFMRHVDFDLRTLTDPATFSDAWLGHYRIRQGLYDAERACNDLITWPPIAARITELRAEDAGV